MAMSLTEFYCDDCGVVIEFTGDYVGVDEDGRPMYEDLKGVTPEDEKHVDHDLSWTSWNRPKEEDIATPEVLFQSIREGLGEIQFIELDEGDRKTLRQIDIDLWDLVDDIMDKKEEA